MKRTFSTYAGWKRAIKALTNIMEAEAKMHATLKLDGNKDICSALIVWPDGYITGLGEWDGEKGEIY